MPHLKDTGPEPILALLASADVAAGEKLAKNVQRAMFLKLAGLTK